MFDYKRQLVGSTIAQMGFMLIQCALGAYLAAIIHLVLHGLFKATLFLQAGSAAHGYHASSSLNEKPSNLWMMSGRVIGLLAGVAFWFMAPDDGYQLVSAIILGWSLSVSWTQLVVFGKGRIGKIAGLAFMIGFSGVYFFIHDLFYQWLHTLFSQSFQPPMWAVIFVVCFLLVGHAIGALAARKQSSTLFAVLYLWFVRFGEAQPKSVESHPNYLKKFIHQGGNQ